MSNVAVAFPLLILMSAVILVPVLVGVYVFRDASRRGMNAVLWTLIAILAPSLIGFIIYLLVRGNYSNLKCPRCEASVTEQYVVCPKCGVKLRPSCPNCSVPIEPDWTVCPKCARPLPAVQEDIAAPVRPKDKTLWKILVAIIVIPVLLILALGLSFSAVSGGGSSSLREVTFDEYFADQELPESAKEYVQEWLNVIPGHANHVYALRYERQSDPESDRRDYYYLLYIPGGGNTDRRGFGYSTGLFGSTFKLDLEGVSNRDGLYCAATTAKSGPPKLKVTLDGRQLTDDITVVDFNPTLYTIVSENDYGTLTPAAGDLYAEEMELEMKPDLVLVAKVEDGQEVAAEAFTEPDFLLNAVVKIHELAYLDETPAFFDGYEFFDYYTISIRYSDTKGEAHYEDASDYWVIEEEGGYYLLESTSDYQAEKDAGIGRLPDNDNFLVSRVDETFYNELGALFEEA